MNYKLEEAEISTTIQELLKKKGISVSELAKYTGLPQPTIQRIASGFYKNPRTTTLQPIAEYFGITVNQLRGIEEIPFLLKKPMISSIPLFNYIDLSEPLYHEKSEILSYILTNHKIGKSAFAIHMPDISMEPTIPKGSILLIDVERIPNHGSYIVVKLQKNGEIIVRQLITDQIKKYVKPLSPELSHLDLVELKQNDKILGVIFEVRFICEIY